MLRDSQFAKDVLVADKLLTDGKKSLDIFSLILQEFFEPLLHLYNKVA